MKNKDTRNLVTIDTENIPIHKISYVLGVLIGMGIPYSINPNSQLYITMREHKKERWQELQLFKKTLPYDDNGMRVLLSGGNEEDIKLTVKRPTKEELWGVTPRRFGDNPVKVSNE